MDENDQPIHLSRRGVAAAAWTVPVIVSTTSAPAMAASPGVCRKYTVLWGTYVRTSSGSQTALRTGTVAASTTGGTTLSIAIRSQSHGNNALSSLEDYVDQTTYTTIQNSASGNYDQTGFCIANINNTGGHANREEVTFTFGVSMRRLSFLVTNIDKNDGHSDAIAVMPTGYSSVFPGATTSPTGSGTIASPFMVQVDGGTNAGYADGVRVDYGETVIPAGTALTVHYWNENQTPNEIAAIYFSQMTFEVCSGDNSRN